MLYRPYSERERGATVVNMMQQALWCVDGMVHDTVRQTQSEIYRLKISDNVERMDLWFVDS
jgi:hypothetical protein